MQDIFQQVLRKESAASGHSAALRVVAEKFPYFGPARFYELAATPADSTDYPRVAAKAALYFNDLFRLDAELLKASAFSETTDQPLTADQQTFPQGQPDVVDNGNLNGDESNTLPSEAEEKNNAAEESELLFEPLHASDYFASQGIRLSEEALGADKLGRQLKSFTSWLKTMKKIHPEKAAEPVAGEAAVKHLAEQSNAGEAVITEAMAEVCVQEGKMQKAADIYSKLSLTNPSKSAYFAAKIESLKR